MNDGATNENGRQGRARTGTRLGVNQMHCHSCYLPMVEGAGLEPAISRLSAARSAN